MRVKILKGKGSGWYANKEEEIFEVSHPQWNEEEHDIIYYTERTKCDEHKYICGRDCEVVEVDKPKEEKPPMKVRITKCSIPGCWYHGSIGNVYEVNRSSKFIKELNTLVYLILTPHEGIICVQDCEVVDERKYLKVRILKGSGWYKSKEGEIFEVSPVQWYEEARDQIYYIKRAEWEGYAYIRGVDCEVVKEDTMNKVYFENEKEAKEFFNVLIKNMPVMERGVVYADHLPIALTNYAKNNGYIKKSVVDEAEYLYNHQDSECNVDETWALRRDLIEKQYQAIQELKHQLEEKSK